MTIGSRPRSRSSISALKINDVKCKDPEKTPTHLCASYNPFRYIRILTIRPSKVDQGHRVTVLH